MVQKKHCRVDKKRCQTLPAGLGLAFSAVSWLPRNDWPSVACCQQLRIGVHPAHAVDYHAGMPPAIAWLNDHAAQLIDFCAALVRAASPNPPGDTRAPAALVEALLTQHGIAFENIASQSHMPNLVASIAGARPGPHLTLIGHLDTYPAGDERAWAAPAFSGHIANGRLHGRGAGDMKSGMAALTYAFLALAQARDFAGRVSLMAVSDEMSFSAHSARHIFATRPDLIGDAAIDAEPTSPDFVLFGEKGMLWLELLTSGDSASSAFAPHAVNAIDIMADVLAELRALRGWRIEMPPQIHAALALGGTRGLSADARTYCDDEVLGLVTVNAGRIEGGRKTNLVADQCRVELDIRLPPGLTLDTVHQAVDAIIAKHDGRARYSVIQSSAPNWTDPQHALVVAMLNAGETVFGVRPRPELGITASDTRLFRHCGLPAAMLGPRIFGQGAPNESIAVSDLTRCAEVYARAAVEYLDNGPA
jgi:succinyl-diaminopimelate desuccinylase